jgi:hypothetical protein
MSNLQVEVAQGDVTEIAADVIVLKHAQGFYGADEAVVRRLTASGVTWAELALQPGEARYVDSQGKLGSAQALFLGTVPLSRLGYHELRQFAGRMLKALESKPGVRHVACTVPGVSVGLDEDEAVLALVGGLIETFQRGVRDLEELRFDVKGHRCLVYKSIRDLETLLAKELASVLA